MTKIDQKKLKEILDYDQVSGKFFWKKKISNKNVVGKEAGFHDIKNSEYVFIRIFGKLYRSHRLAHLYMTGEWPKRDFDHNNQIKSDNSCSNLRPATRSENNMNSKIRKNNTTGFRGVSFVKEKRGRKSYFHAYINKDNKRENIGYYQDPISTAKAYDKRSLELYGEFAFLNFPDEDYKK